METLLKTAFPFAIFALLAALIIVSVAAVASEDLYDGSGGIMKGNYFYKQLDSYAVNHKPAMYVIERINEKLKKEPDMLAVAYNWAKAMTSVTDADQINSLYFMLRSDMAHRIAKTITKRDSRNYRKYGLDALQSILTFEMMLMADAARCKGNFDPTIISDLLGPRYEQLGQYVYSLLLPSEMPNYWGEALQNEVSLKGREMNKEICSNGARIGLLITQGAPKSKIPESITAETIDDAQWSEERDRLRYSIKDFWKNRYESRTDKTIKTK